MEKQLSQYEEYYNKWENTKQLLKQKYGERSKSYGQITIGEPKAPKLSKYVGSAMNKIAIISLVLFLIIGVASFVGCATMEFSSSSDKNEFWLWFFRINGWTGGFIFYPIFLLIGVFIRMAFFGSYKKKYEALLAARDEYFRKMNEFAQPEIEKYETKPQIQEITKFLVDRFDSLILYIRRQSKYPRIGTTLDFKVTTENVYYLYESSHYGETEYLRKVFDFNDHRFQKLPETHVYLVAATLMRTVEKAIRKQRSKDPSGTDYTITSFFEEKICHQREDYIKDISHNLYYTVNTTMRYTANNGYYEESKSW